MKKSIILVFAAMAAITTNAQMRVWVNGQIHYEENLSEIDSITFVKPVVQPENTTEQIDTTLTVTPHEIFLNENKPSALLTVSLEPADPTLTISWSSTDTTVATVTSRGFVESVGYGDCYIIAQAGTLKDSCLIKVRRLTESLVFNTALVWDIDTTYARDPETGVYRVDTIKTSNGSVWYVYPALATLRVFSEGFYVNNSGFIDGIEKGAILDIEAPMYYGTEYLNPEFGYGVQFILGEWSVVPSPSGETHVGAAASIDEAEYLKQLKSFIADYNAGSKSYGQYLKAAGQCITGAHISVLKYNQESGDYVNSYIPDGLCGNAVVSLGDASPVSNYMRQLDYSYVEYKTFALDTVFGERLVTGLNLGYDADKEEIFLNDETVHYSETIISTFGELPSAESKAAMKPLHMPVISENPELKASLEKQVKEKNIKVIKVR